VLRSLGITDDCVLRLCQTGDPCIVQVRATRIGLSNAVARCLYVVPEAGSASTTMVPAVETPDRAPASTAAPARRIALIGNPNTGKTTLFNALCGVRARLELPRHHHSMRTGHAERPGTAPSTCSICRVYDLGSTPRSRIAATLLEGAGRCPMPSWSSWMRATGAQPRARGSASRAACARAGAQHGGPGRAARLAINAVNLEARLGVPVVPMVARTDAAWRRCARRSSCISRRGGPRR
jgi:ferrous iron transport protein B